MALEVGSRALRARDPASFFFKLFLSGCFVWCYGTEFTSKALDHWAYKNGVHLDFIRPGRPVENGYIESFNGKLRDECLNVEVFFNLADARRKLYHWRRDYNHHRPHSALDDRTPAEFAATCAAEGCVPKLASGHIPRQLSTSLLETLT